METKTFRDNRGVIETLTDTVLRVESNSGVTRANHYHKTSGHWCVVQTGSIYYYERTAGLEDRPTFNIFKAGDLFLTEKMKEHAMYFPEDTVFYCFSFGARDQKSYEEDLVRLNVDLVKEYEQRKV